MSDLLRKKEQFAHSTMSNSLWTLMITERMSNLLKKMLTKSLKSYFFVSLLYVLKKTSDSPIPSFVMAKPWTGSGAIYRGGGKLLR